MPRPRSPARRHSRSPRRQVNRRHRSPSPRSRSRSRGRSPVGTSYKERRYSRDSPPTKARRSRRQSPSPPPKQKYGGRRSRSYSPAGRRSRTPNRGYQDRQSGRSSPKTYRDPSPEYYQKPKDSQQMPTYVVVNRERSYSPDRRQGNGRQQYEEQPRDLDARLREMEARSPEITKPRLNSKGEDYAAGTSYEKPRHRGDRSPDGFQGRSSRNYEEPARKDNNDDNYQASGKTYSPPRNESRDQRRNSSTNERKRSKDPKYKRSPDRYQSPEPEQRKYKESDSRRERESNNNHDHSRRDDGKYSEKKERSGRDRSSNRGTSSRDGFEKSHRGSTSDKSRQDREPERDQKAVFDPTLVIVPRRKDEGQGGIFNRPEILMRPITDDPDNQPMPFEEKRVVAVMPGKPLPGPAMTERDIHRDYLELLARKSSNIGDFDIRNKDKYRDLGLDAPQTLSSRFQGASSLDLLTTLENFEINRTKNLERELELRREMDLLRDRSPLRLSDLQSDLEGRLGAMSRKVEPKNPRDLRYDLESRRKQLKSGRTDTAVSPRRVSKKGEKDSKLRMTSADRRPVRERLGLSPGKKERRSFDRRHVEDREVLPLPDFKREVEELQKAQWLEDPKSVPKGPGYFEHDDREGEGNAFQISPRGRGLRRGRGITLRGRISPRGRGGFFRGGFRGSSFRGSFGTRARGFGGRGRGLSLRGRGARYSPQWKHDKFDEEGKEKRSERTGERERDSKPKMKKEVPNSSRSGDRSGDKHSSRRDDRKSKDTRDTKRTERHRDTSGSRRESRDSRKDRR